MYLYKKPSNIEYKIGRVALTLDEKYVSIGDGILRIGIEEIDQYIEVLRDLKSLYNMDLTDEEKIR